MLLGLLLVAKTSGLSNGDKLAGGERSGAIQVDFNRDDLTGLGKEQDNLIARAKLWTGDGPVGQPPCDLKWQRKFGASSGQSVTPAQALG